MGHSRCARTTSWEIARRGCAHLVPDFGGGISVSTIFIARPAMHEDHSAARLLAGWPFGPLFRRTRFACGPCPGLEPAATSHHMCRKLVTCSTPLLKTRSGVVSNIQIRQLQTAAFDVVGPLRAKQQQVNCEESRRKILV